MYYKDIECLIHFNNKIYNILFRNINQGKYKDFLNLNKYLKFNKDL